MPRKKTRTSFLIIFVVSKGAASSFISFETFKVAEEKKNFVRLNRSIKVYFFSII